VKSEQATPNEPVREVFLGFATLAVSLVSLLPLYWAAFLLGDYGDRATDPFPSFVRGAAVVSLVIVGVSALLIGPYWRVSPALLAIIASGLYFLSGLGTGLQYTIVWAGAGLVVFAIFYSAARWCCVPNPPDLKGPP
jgi:hypothetical protein